MTVSAGSLDILVTADTAEASSSLSKFAAAAEREMKRTERASQQAQRESDRMTAGLQKQIDTFGMTGAEIQKYEMRLKGASAAQLDMVDRLQRMRDAQAAFNTTAGAGGLGGAAEGIKKSAHEMEGFSFQTAGAKRELLVLAHELSQGNFKQFGGSMLVLGERTGAASLLFSGLGLAALGTVAALGAFAFAAVKGAMESDALGKSLILTGNYAGITEGQFNAMAHSVADSTGASIGKVREIEQGLVSTGQFGPKVIGPMTEAIALLQKATGEDAAKIVDDFAKMGDGVAKWAEEHNKSLNFITLAQYEYIRNLEEQGKKEEAELVVAKAISDHLAGPLQANLGALDQTLKVVANGWHAFWDAAHDIGRTKTVEQKIADIDARLALRSGGNGGALGIGAGEFGIGASEGAGSDDADITTRNGLLREQGTALAAALKKSDDAMRAKSGIAASDELKKLDDKTKGVDRLAEALKRLETQENAVRAAGGIVTDEDHDRRVAELRKENAPPKGARSSQDKLESAFDKAMNSMGAENAKLDAEIDSWERFGKAIDKSRVAVALFDIAQGKLKGKGGAELTMSEKGAYLEQAALADAKQATLEQEKAIAADTKRTESILSVANAQAMNARETKIATEIAGLQTAKGTAGYEALAQARRDAVNAEFDSKLNQTLAAQRLANDQEIESLREQIRLIGMSTVERQKDAAARKLQKQAEKEIAANPGQTAQILDDMVAKQIALTEQIQRTYDASRTASAGVATALQKYQEDATNYAKGTNELTSHILGGLEDGLTALLTGKKFNFKSFVDSIISEAMRLYVVKPLLADIFGGGSGGGLGGMAAGIGGGMNGGGLLGSLFKGAGSMLGGGYGFGGTGFGASMLATDTGVTGSLAGDLIGGLIALDSGTNYVPYDGMPAVLHKGEAVVPARYNPAAENARGGGGRSQTNHITVNAPPGMNKQTAGQIGATIARQLAMADRRGN